MERRGLFTPDQEQTWDKLLKWKNPAVELIDGTAIKIIDNQGLERAKQTFLDKFPQAEEALYEIVDTLMEGVEAMAEQDD